MTIGEGDWKELYYWAMVNASRKHAWMPNWALIVKHGVGSTRAYEICRELGVDPESIVFKRKESQSEDTNNR